MNDIIGFDLIKDSERMRILQLMDEGNAKRKISYAKKNKDGA